MLQAELVWVGGSRAVYFSTENGPRRSGASSETPSHDNGGFLFFKSARINLALCFCRHRWELGMCRGSVFHSMSLTRGLVGAQPLVVFAPRRIESVCSSLSPIKIIVIESQTAYKRHRGWAEAWLISCRARRVVQPLSAAASAPLWFFPFTSLPALLRLRALQDFGNVPDYFPAVMACGKGIVFGQPLAGSPKPPVLPTTSVCKAKATLSGEQLTVSLLEPCGF